MIAARPVVIYAISDVQGGVPRYIGKTEKALKTRLQGHLVDARKRPDRPRAAWMLSVLNAGGSLYIEEIETVQPGDDWAEAERYWIAQMKAYGFALLNCCEGGQGRSGYRYTPEQRERLRQAHAGQRRTPEIIEKWQKAMAQRRADGIKRARRRESVEKWKATMKERYPIGSRVGRWSASPEFRQRVSAARRAADSPEYRARISAGRKGVLTGPMPAARRAKISESRKRLFEQRRQSL